MTPFSSTCPIDSRALLSEPAARPSFLRGFHERRACGAHVIKGVQHSIQASNGQKLPQPRVVSAHDSQFTVNLPSQADQQTESDGVHERGWVNAHNEISAPLRNYVEDLSQFGADDYIDIAVHIGDPNTVPFGDLDYGDLAPNAGIFYLVWHGGGPPSMGRSPYSDNRLDSVSPVKGERRIEGAAGLEDAVGKDQKPPHDRGNDLLRSLAAGT